MIDIHQLRHRYGETPVLQEIFLSVAPKEFAAIIGPNGAGKSTLLKLMAGTLKLQHGEVKLMDKPLAGYRRKDLAKIVGFVPQEFRTTFDFTGYEIVSLGRYPYQSPFAGDADEDRQIIRAAMEETDVWQFRERRFSELSGGEHQRVILASALAQEPQALLLDEPTTALDIKHQIQFYKILQRLQQEKELTIVTVTHDINLAARFCQRIIVLKNGEIVADDAPERVINKPLMEAVYEVELEVVPHPQDGKPLLLIG